MTITFPETVSFGTSTSAYQIETACEHDWCDVLSRDGHLFSRTTEHEKRYAEDIAIITALAPNYRMSLMWSRLQRSPCAAFDPGAKQEYHELLQGLTANGIRIMMVLHHFANPNWFAAMGGWERASNIPLWIDYACKVVDEYGPYVSSWNTFNEPNLYTSMGWVAGEFPPFRKNMLVAKRVINHLAQAHEVLYDYIKEKYPHTMVGISHNCTLFAAHNALGTLPAKIADWCYMEYSTSRFTKTDFFGMSYYARIAYDPLPITYLLRPGRVKALGMTHDDMWEYYPQGLKACMLRFWKQYKKPIIITENGICTNDDTKRVQAIGDYARQVYEAMQEGVDVKEYYHWSAWDNFEWSLGPTFRFGLYHCDYQTMQRTPKPSAAVYAKLAYTRQVEVDG
jgi:beta-glucosidase